MVMIPHLSGILGVEAHRIGNMEQTGCSLFIQYKDGNREGATYFFSCEQAAINAFNKLSEASANAGN